MPSLVFNSQFTVDKVEKELVYFKKKNNKSFERTYGWAWLLKLQEELVKLKEDWADTLQPLVQHIVASWTDFQPKLVYPIRVGEHTNTAFGLSFAMDYCRCEALWRPGQNYNIWVGMLRGTMVWPT